MKKQDKIIKIDYFLRTNKTSFIWNQIEAESDFYYQLILQTDIGNLTMHLNVEDTPYTLITCTSNLEWDDSLIPLYYKKANEWMLISDILRVIIDLEAKRIVFSYTYTAQEDFFDPASLIAMADSLVQKVLETCLPAIHELKKMKTEDIIK
jgi:hypothetical protein